MLLLKFIAWVDPHSQFCYKATKTLPCFKNKKNCSFAAKKDQTNLWFANEFRAEVDPVV